MAALSSTQSAIVTQGRSPEGGQGAWNFSVPVSGETNLAEENTASEYTSKPTSSGPRNPPSQTTGPSRPKQRRTNTLDSQNSGRSLQHQESANNLRPNRINQLSRKQSDISGSGSDADSLVDLYNHSNGPSRNGAYSAMGEKRKVTANGSYSNDKKTNDKDKWIHAELLAQIERGELVKAGFSPEEVELKMPSRRTMSRSESRDRERRSRSQSRKAVEEYNLEEAPPPASALHSRYSSKDLKEDRRQKMATPVMPTGDEMDESMGEGDDRNGWDLRTPEEIAAERERANSTQRSTSRPGGSRLPLARDSPIPVPHVVVERDSPLTRSRQGSTAAGNSILEPAIVFTRPHRSASIGSEALLDDMDEPKSPVYSPQTPSPPRDSPTKSKNPANPSGRKTTARDRNARPKSRQGSGANKRPGTSEGIRPSTGHRINRPEGEAPWIATMYKPDPSLPPDQQIIPTHAKKMAQEQWKNKNTPGAVYDTNFELLREGEFLRPVSKSPDRDLEKKQEEPQTWPILAPPSPKPDAGRPGTSGGYKTIPTISSPQIPPRSTPTPKPAQSPRPHETIRLEDPGEDEKKQKKGCCCIVM